MRSHHTGKTLHVSGREACLMLVLNCYLSFSLDHKMEFSPLEIFTPTTTNISLIIKIFEVYFVVFISPFVHPLVLGITG